MSVRQVFAKLYQFENYPHFNTERTRRSSMVVGGILYLFNWRYLRYCTRSLNASWTTLSSNLVSIDRLVIELWSKAAGHTVAEGAMVHGVELCVSRRCECCVLCVCQKSVDVEVPKRAIWGGSPQSLLSVSYLHCMVSEYNEGISNSNELERMMQRSAFGGINRYYLLIQWII